MLQPLERRIYIYMRHTIDLANQRFHRLAVMHISKFRSKQGSIQWVCLCDCGNTTLLTRHSLTTGNTTSCGCRRREGLHRTHGMRHTRFYRIWIGMRQRCLNPNNTIYKYYGGRGISFCKDWEKFENFRNDMYESYLEHALLYGETSTSIERKNVNGNYSFSNTCWATPKEQSKNRRPKGTAHLSLITKNLTSGTSKSALGGTATTSELGKSLRKFS